MPKILSTQAYEDLQAELEKLRVQLEESQKRLAMEHKVRMALTKEREKKRSIYEQEMKRLEEEVGRFKAIAESAKRTVKKTREEKRNARERAKRLQREMDVLKGK